MLTNVTILHVYGCVYRLDNVTVYVDYCYHVAYDSGPPEATREVTESATGC